MIRLILTICIGMFALGTIACRHVGTVSAPELRYDETGPHFYAKLPAEPYGTIVLIIEANHPKERESLPALASSLCETWPSQWPKYRKRIERMLRDYEMPNLLKNNQIMLSVVSLTPNSFMGDKATHLLSFSLDDSGASWDFFIKEQTIVHHQPVL